ncbi:flavin reductase family protein [Nocardioides alkalitolerans]|uniref:flavin reductase family protein n=1 Tax=Nocardioides alkalitolerans TaxID=281714 RepID=UPI000693EEE6|nr:flavin reductase family protein [Nocardioides alkalitolerans]
MSVVEQEAVVHPVTDAEFRSAMGRFSSGVTVITTRHEGQDLGATVSAFSSVSNNPPSVLVCLNVTSDTGRAVQENRGFVVNVLSRRQGALAMRFAGKGAGKFEGLPFDRSSAQHPVLRGTHVSLECEVSQEVLAGTHLVFIARVVAIRSGQTTAPLTYHSGAFGRFLPSLDSAARVELSDFGTDHHDLW